MKIIECEELMSLVSAGTESNFIAYSIPFGEIVMMTWATSMGYMIGSLHPSVRPFATFGGLMFGYVLGTDMYKAPEDRWLSIDMSAPYTK